MNALMFLIVFIELILLFSRHDVAKEYRILRKWTKKMSILEIDETLLCKIRRGYIINGPKGGWGHFYVHRYYKIKIKMSSSEEELPNQKEEYARLIRELDELEKKHAGLRQQMAAMDASGKPVIEMYELMEQKCLKLLKEWDDMDYSKDDTDYDEAHDDANRMFDAIIARMRTNLENTVHAYREQVMRPLRGSNLNGYEWRSDQLFYDLYRKLDPILTQHEYYDMEYSDALRIHAAKEAARAAREAAMREAMMSSSWSRSVPTPQRFPEGACFTYECAKKLAKEHAATRWIDEAKTHLAQLNQALKQKYGNKYVAYLNQKPEYNYRYYYVEHKANPKQSVSRLEHPDHTERQIRLKQEQMAQEQREQQQQKVEFNAHLSDLAKKSEVKSGVIFGNSAWRLHIVLPDGTDIVIPLKFSAWPTSGDDIIDIITQMYGEHVVRPVFKGKRAGPPSFIFNGRAITNREKIEIPNDGTIKMVYPPLHEWRPVSRGGKSKKRMAKKPKSMRKGPIKKGNRVG
jgi:hypothetical protein